MNGIESKPHPTPAYALGHSSRELQRLRSQARLIDPVTRQILIEAGIGPGMRVLDVGSGAGDVAFLVADLVGERGEVVGVDRAAPALRLARARAAARGTRNVSFRQGDASALAFDRFFDAVIGRYVIQYQPDPVAMLRELAARLRPGGLMVFQESDWSTARSLPVAPLYQSCCRWITQTMEALGAEMRMGLKLHTVFLGAGLSDPSMLSKAFIGGGRHAFDRIELVVGLIETLHGAIVRTGIASEAEIEIGTLADRLHEEVVAGGGIIIGHADIGAWARV